jgi:hypothetical protein
MAESIKQISPEKEFCGERMEQRKDNSNRAGWSKAAFIA